MRRHRLGRNLIPLIEGLEDSEYYKKLCELKQYLHTVTKCTFVDGKCTRVRNGGEAQCCMHCASYSGYLNFFTKKEEYYLKLFDKKKGFLSDEGCILPVELRSTTCVFYCCAYQREELGSKYDLSIDAIMSKREIQVDRAKELERKILRSVGL